MEEVRLKATDGVTLHGWLIKAAGSEPLPLILYFGGNAEEVSWLAGRAGAFPGWSLLLVNYRGYGLSEGAPTERELFSDALQVYDYAARRGDVDPRRMVAMGRSLGSGVATYLATQRPLRAVALISPYDSIAALAQGVYPYVPVSLLLRHRFDSLSRAPTIRVPLLMLTASDDTTIPLAHSRKLFEAWGGPKEAHTIAHAGHDDIVADPQYWDNLSRFLRSQQ